MKEFVHKISKGSRYNQIYIPQEAEGFEVGDIVKVILLKKKTHLYSSKNFKIGEFKKNLIERIFKLLPGGKRVFIVGSFLFKKADYNDIDVLLIGNAGEEGIYKLLTEKLGLKFHILTIKDNAFENLIKTCPLTRSMLSYFVSNKEFNLPKYDFDINHIKFLLMMPQDLLKIEVNSRVFYDNIRRLIAIERFLEKNSLDSLKIEKEAKKLLGSLFLNTKNNEAINNKDIKKIREIIKLKLKKIDKLIKKWEKEV